MYEHRARVVIPAPVDRVYELFTYLHRYPDFLRHVKSVEYYDDQNSHWVVDVNGRREWDALNDPWQRNLRIGWQANDSPNFGEVLFHELGDDATQVYVRLGYEGAASVTFERALHEDLQRFAWLVGEVRRDGGEADWDTIRRRRPLAERGSVTAGFRQRIRR